MLLVIAFFDRMAGEVAARALRQRADAGSCGTVGLLRLSERGQVDTGPLGDRFSDAGPGVGVVLGPIALALSGGVLSAREHLFDARSEFSTDDLSRIGAELDAGQVAVAVLARQREAECALIELTALGGRAEVHRLTDAALDRAVSAPPPVPSSARSYRAR